MSNPAHDAQMFWRHDHLASLLGGVWASEPSGDLTPTGVSIDTRDLREGQFFVAMQGERTDGHAYLREARGAGARFAIIEREIAPPPGLACLRVQDSARALGALASAYRRGPLANATVVGVTGSAGKTSTVRLLHAMLRGSMRVASSVKSHNNHLGVAITLLNAPPETEAVVCEIGTSAPGEIASLCEMARPDLAIITRVAQAHLEGLGTVRDIAEEKGALLDALPASGFACVASDPALQPVVMRTVIRGVQVRALGRDIHADQITVDRASTRCIVTIEGYLPLAMTIPLLGEHHARNAALACAIALRLGCSPGDVAQGALACEAPAMRGALETIAGAEVLLDAYNANPASVRAAIDLLARIEPAPGSARLAILGDMLELGDESDSLHAQVLRTLAGLPLLRGVVLIGPAMTRAAEAMRAGGFTGEILGFPEADDPSIERAASVIQPGDLVLIKGSRGLRLERVAERLRLRAPAAQTGR